MSPPVVPRFHHSVKIADESTLLDTAAGFVADGLDEGQPAIVIATPAHRDGILARLAARGVVCETATRAGDLTIFDASQTLKLFMVDDAPDPARFETLFGAVIEHARRDRPQTVVRVYGEGVDLLCERGLTSAAAKVERLCNHLALSFDISILCGYSPAHFETVPEFRDHVCALHSHVVAGTTAPIARGL
jgi:MEDS: MEthanogen/methylotroph, DcmR Sensory domain